MQIAILSRMYPCKECADHFKEVLRVSPVQAGSHAEFSQWLCHVHNVVNRSHYSSQWCSTSSIRSGSLIRMAIKGCIQKSRLLLFCWSPTGINNRMGLEVRCSGGDEKMKLYLVFCFISHARHVKKMI